MTMHAQGGSATIYQFPARGRFAVSGQRDESKPPTSLMARAANVVSGSGWYHEEAIREAELLRKN